MDIHLFNKLVAGLLFKKQRATRDHIRACAARVPEGKDLGKFMVHKGVIDKDTYLKVRSYIGKMRENANFEEKAREIVQWTARQGLFPETGGGETAAASPVDVAQEPAVEIAPEASSIPLAVEPDDTDATRIEDTNTQQLRTRPVSMNLIASEDEEEPDAAESVVPSGYDTLEPGSQPDIPRPKKPPAEPSGEYEKIQKKPPDTSARDMLPAAFRGSAGDGQPEITIPRTIQDPRTLDELLLFARKAQASDIHLSPGSPVTLRRFGSLIQVSKEDLSQSQIQVILESALSDDQIKAFYHAGDLELAYSVTGGGRFRLTILEQRFGWELTARVIPTDIRPFDEIGLPESCRALTKWATGMVLLTGPSGCGKSSTLATLVDLINRERSDHIITIESPVETVYPPVKCQITQREIGMQTLSQGNALRAALRQDPDILVIGELRDLDTIRLAVSAAETGHLVFATMNTANAVRTINRLIDSFPPEEQDQIRSMISESLRGIISQQLLPLKDGSGMIPAFEVLIITNAVGNMIRKKNTHQLNTVMVTGKADGHVLLDNSLRELLQKDLVEGEQVYYRASSPKDFLDHAPQALKDLADGNN